MRRTAVGPVEHGFALPLAVGAGVLIAASQLMLAALAPGLTHGSATSIATVLPLILLIGLPAALALAATPFLLRLRDGRAVLIAVILFGVAIRFVWFFAPPMIEDDFYRYLWDGAVLAQGFNPYTYSPAEIAAGGGPAELQALAAEGRGILSAINFPHLRSIYPGTAESVFAVAHWLAPFSVTGLRALFFGAELATLALLIALLGRMGLSPLGCALYWCNPFPAVMLVGQAHMDALLPPFVLGALVLAADRRFALAGGALALAAGVKLWPIVLAPLLFRPILFDIRRMLPVTVVTGGVLMLVAGPLLLSSLGAQSGLTAYAAGWANNNAPYAWTLWTLQGVFGPERAVETGLRFALAAAGGLVALWIALQPRATMEDLVRGALIVGAATFYLSPAQFPWYAAWFLPLAALARNGPLLAASALLPFYYLFFPLWQTDRGDWFVYGAAFLHSVPVFTWLALSWWTRAPRGDVAAMERAR